MNTNNPLVLALDIGNTFARVGMVDVQKKTCCCRYDFPVSGLQTKLPGIVVLLGRKNPGMTVAASAVVPRLKKIVDNIIRKSANKKTIWVEHSLSCPIRIIYKKPRTLGADRLADLIFCQHAYPGKNVVVIDAGTAVTVDYLQNGNRFCGGTMFPGINAQLSCLHSQTAALPEIVYTDEKIRFPGTSTEECMKTGVVLGVAGAISRIVDEYRNITKGTMMVVATGGAWPEMERHVDFECRYVKDLTLIGTGLYTRINEDVFKKPRQGFSSTRC